MSASIEGTRDATPTDPRSVFVVHGRNAAARVAMFDFLRSLDLRPMEWSHAVELTGVASPYIGDVLEAAFSNAVAVVVLMTPDEIAYLQPRYGSSADDPETAPAPQARPNVLFEAGMALGRHPSRTVIVELGTVRPFSDVAGRHVVRLSNDVAKRQELAQRLKTAGCAVDMTGTDWQTAGNFATPLPLGEGLRLGRRIPSSSSRPAIDLDAKFYDRGVSKLGKLQIINRGSETAFNVSVHVPQDAGMTIYGEPIIEKIPGGGKSVSLDVSTDLHMMGRSGKLAFDIRITADTANGDQISQDVFLDLNG